MLPVTLLYATALLVARPVLGGRIIGSCFDGFECNGTATLIDAPFEGTTNFYPSPMGHCLSFLTHTIFGRLCQSDDCRYGCLVLSETLRGSCVLDPSQSYCGDDDVDAVQRQREEQEGEEEERMLLEQEPRAYVRRNGSVGRGELGQVGDGDVVL